MVDTCIGSKILVEKITSECDAFIKNPKQNSDKEKHSCIVNEKKC